MLFKKVTFHLLMNCICMFKIYLACTLYYVLEMLTKAYLFFPMFSAFVQFIYSVTPGHDILLTFPNDAFGE